MKENKNMLYKSINSTATGIDSKIVCTISLTLFFYRYISDKGDFVIPQGCSFKDVQQKIRETWDDRCFYEAMDAIERSNGDSLSGLMTVWHVGDISYRVLQNMFNIFGSFDLDYFSGKEFDVLIESFASSPSLRGSSLTSSDFSDLVSELINLDKQESIYDPFCGYGNLLTSCVKKTEQHSMYGQEINSFTFNLAKMRAIIHGEKEFKVELGDTLRSPKFLNEDGSLMKFDVVVSQPPFGIKNWGYEELEMDKWNRFKRGIPGRGNGDYACISHIIESMKPENGRSAVIMPHGVLFRGGKEGQIREKIIEENLLETVIGLPGGLLYDTAIPVCILIFNTSKKDDKVFFINVPDVEIKGHGRKKMLSKDETENIVEVYRKREVISGYSYLADMDEIRAKNYEINLMSYVDNFTSEERSILNNPDLKKTRIANVTRKVFKGQSVFSKKEEGNVLVLNIINIDEDGYIDYDTDIKTVENTSTKYALEDGDILIACRGTLAKVAIFSKREEDNLVIPSVHLIAIRPDPDLLDSTYLKIFLESPLGQKIIEGKSKGTSILNMTVKAVENIEIPLVPLERQKEIAKKYVKERIALKKAVSNWEKAKEEAYKNLFMIK